MTQKFQKLQNFGLLVWSLLWVIYLNYVIVKRTSKIHSSRTAYYNFDLGRLMSLFYCYFRNNNKVHNQNMISTKIVMTSFREKLRKFRISTAWGVNEKFSRSNFLIFFCKNLRSTEFFWTAEKFDVSPLVWDAIFFFVFDAIIDVLKANFLSGVLLTSSIVLKINPEKLSKF